MYFVCFSKYVFFVLFRIKCVFFRLNMYFLCEAQCCHIYPVFRAPKDCFFQKATDFVTFPGEIGDFWRFEDKTGSLEGFFSPQIISVPPLITSLCKTQTCAR